MSPRRLSPRPLSLTLEKERKAWEPATLLAEIQTLWPSVVGEAISRQAVPASERGGVLTVSCSASVWAQELDLMALSILERLNGRLGEGEIRRLRCITVPAGDC
jgi:predicted nucleic acid-binding Zn ribbon protein